MHFSPNLTNLCQTEQMHKRNGRISLYRPGQRNSRFLFPAQHRLPRPQFPGLFVNQMPRILLPIPTVCTISLLPERIGHDASYASHRPAPTASQFLTAHCPTENHPSSLRHQGPQQQLSPIASEPYLIYPIFSEGRFAPKTDPLTLLPLAQIPSSFHFHPLRHSADLLTLKINANFPILF